MTMIIDTHTHCYPDALAERAVSKLGTFNNIHAYTNGTFEDTIKCMQSCGIDKFVSLNIATKPNQDAKVNDFALATNSQNCIAFGSVNPYSQQIEARLARLSYAGIKGIKLHPEYQHFDVLSKEAIRLYDMLCDFDFVITFHAGWDVAFPDSNNASPKSLAKLTELYPNLKFVFAHMGGMKKWQEVLDCLAGANCWLDTAMCAGYLDTDLFLKIAQKHGFDHILFGSDCPWQLPSDTLNWLKQAQLDADKQEKILYKNAKSLLRL